MDQNQNNYQDTATTQQAQPEPQQQQDDDVVTLTGAQYDALLDRLAELETISLSTGKDKPSSQIRTLDDLADEGQRPTQPQPTGPQKDLNDMDNRELVGFIADMINPVAQDLATRVETVRLLREIDKVCEKYDDFEEYQDQVLDIGRRNPRLSVEEAYVLAKGRSPKAKQASSEEGEPNPSKRTLIYTLPKRVTPGERPGVPTHTTRTTTPVTIESAAERAWEDIHGKDK